MLVEKAAFLSEFLESLKKILVTVYFKYVIPLSCPVLMYNLIIFAKIITLLMLTKVR